MMTTVTALRTYLDMSISITASFASVGGSFPLYCAQMTMVLALEFLNICTCICTYVLTSYAASTTQSNIIRSNTFPSVSRKEPDSVVASPPSG